MRKTPFKPEEIRYWYLVPVEIKFHYWSDGEDSFIDTILDIAMTEANINRVEEVVKVENITYEKVLEESLNAMLEKVKRDLRLKLPPEKQEDCSITITITGPISKSKEPIN